MLPNIDFIQWKEFIITQVKWYVNKLFYYSFFVSKNFWSVFKLIFTTTSTKLQKWPALANGTTLQKHVPRDRNKTRVHNHTQKETT